MKKRKIIIALGVMLVASTLCTLYSRKVLKELSNSCLGGCDL